MEALKSIKSNIREIIVKSDEIRNFLDTGRMVKILINNTISHWGCIISSRGKNTESMTPVENENSLIVVDCFLPVLLIFVIVYFFKR